jgi:hypothetical protein
VTIEAGSGTGEGQGTPSAGQEGAAGTGAPAGEQQVQGQEGQQQQQQQVPADWPSDWRVKLAGEDTKTLERLGRFNSVKDVWQSYTNMEKKLSSGQYKPELPSDRQATAEELSAYRKANGIPETPAEYLKALPDGMVVGEDDKAAIELLTNRLHAQNASPAIVAEAVKTYYDAVEHAQEQAIEAQKVFKQQAEDTLRKEWGGEFRSNINAIANLMSSQPELKQLLSTATLADGSMALNNPTFLRWAAGIARELNPAAAVVGPGHGDPMTNVTTRLAELDKMMKTNIDAWQAPANNANRAEYYKLLQAQEKITSRR